MATLWCINRGIRVVNENAYKSCIGGKGFTLIEMLVVVLIIGVLAAIALPQYQKAVEKNRLNEALEHVKTIQTCFNWYILEHGLPTSGTVLLQDMNCPVEINLGEFSENDSRWRTQNFEYSVACYSVSENCAAEIIRLPYEYTLFLEVTPTILQKWCFTQETTRGREICNSLRGQGWEYFDEEL